MDCSLPGSSVHGFSRQEYWSGPQVYIINVTWSDSTSQTIYRRYSKFFDLQVSESELRWGLVPYEVA